MFDYFQQLSARVPDFLWNFLLFAIAIAIGLITGIVLKSIIRAQGPGDRQFSFWQSVPRRLNRPLAFFLPWIALDLMMPLFRVHPRFYAGLDKFVYIALLVAFAGLLMALLKICEDYLYFKYDIRKSDNLKERKIRTQLQFIRRLAVIFIIVVTLSLILMSFDSLRRLGAGLLTGVGVGGIIIGFAAQKSLSSFLAGFQIAFTQPIRIDDVLIVEGEWGRVDEITLTYVVLKLWDLRNLIIPIGYFNEKPFQNWTRTGAELIGSVFVYVDYSIPVDALRTELDRLLRASPLWNGKTSVVQVTNATEKTIELRALVSANNSSDAFDLRCIVREGLIKFVRENYPASLPAFRVDMNTQKELR